MPWNDQLDELKEVERTPTSSYALASSDSWWNKPIMVNLNVYMKGQK